MNGIISTEGVDFDKFCGLSDERVCDFKKDVVFPIAVEFLDHVAVTS